MLPHGMVQKAASGKRGSENLTPLTKHFAFTLLGILMQALGNNMASMPNRFTTNFHECLT